jgi:phage tail-like protein
MANSNTSPNNPGVDVVRSLAVGYFYVEIPNFTLVFKEVSGLQIETEVFEYREGGVNDYIHRLPGPTKSGNIILKRGMGLTQEFLEWYGKILAGNIVRHNVIITMYQTKPEEKVVQWRVIDAWPCKWSGPHFIAGDNTVAIESLELAHSGLELT